MNVADYVLLGLLLVAVFIGSKRGFFSGLLGAVSLIAAVVFSINYVDWTTSKLLEHMRVSTIMVVFLSFIFMFVLVYIVAKLLGNLFYKVGSLRPLGKVDKIGGAIVGVFQGWILLGFLLFLLIFLPLPDSVVAELDSSFFAPGMRGVIPLIYEETTFLHPQSPYLVDKIKDALKTKPGEGSQKIMGEAPDDTQVKRIIDAMEYYFVR
jgi:membrane protein required for colicin V production